MSRTRIRFAVTAAAAAGLFAAVVAGSPAANADPATPNMPAIPGLNLVQQFATAPAQALQNAASVLTGAKAAAPTPPPLATAAFSLPQAPALPGVPGLPAAAPVAPPANLMPLGDLNLPKVPGLALPLPGQLSFPGDLAQLIPGSLGLPSTLGNPGNPGSIEAPAAATAPSLLAPAATTPAAPAAPPTNPATNPITSPATNPVQTPLAALLPLSALP